MYLLHLVLVSLMNTQETTDLSLHFLITHLQYLTEFPVLTANNCCVLKVKALGVQAPGVLVKAVMED